MRTEDVRTGDLRGQGRGCPRPGRLLALCSLTTLLLSGCGREGASGQDALLVLGASQLLAAFEELVPLHEERTGERIDVVLGSTGSLAAQIRNGAPADLFFSANEEFLDDLIAAGRVEPDSRAAYAVGRLALVVPPGSDLPEDEAHLVDPRFRTIAIANPDHAPYGWAAREALRTLGIWDELQPRLVLGDNVAHALQFVSTGNAEGGLVALSLVAGPAGSGVPYRLVDAALHPPMLQVAGVVTGTRMPERASAFLAFVLSDEGQAILARYGFEAPPAY